MTSSYRCHSLYSRNTFDLTDWRDIATERRKSEERRYSQSIIVFIEIEEEKEEEEVEEVEGEKENKEYSVYLSLSFCFLL